jgi:hypothetical protein
LNKRIRFQKSSTTHSIVKRSEQLDGYNLGAWLDLDHTTIEQLYDARNVRPNNMPPPLPNAQSTRKWLNSYNFAANDFDYTTGSKHQKPAQ